MNAELKRVHSPDIQNLESYMPENSETFGFLLQAMVGPEGEDGEESVDIEVCTPKWLEENYGQEDVVVGRHHLIVREYDYAVAVKDQLPNLGVVGFRYEPPNPRVV